MRTDLHKPCIECPFRRESMAGWLGPWKPGDLLRSLAHTEFPCHRTIRSSDQALDDPRLQGCAGAAIFLNNKIELSRCAKTATHQKKVRSVPDAVKAEVFASSAEFLAHHGGGE